MPVTLARVRSQALLGIESPPVEVEVHVANGLPAFNIVGLPEAAVRESRDRVRAAILQSGFDFPNRRLTVNLAPADLPKDSGRFDLPIAIGVLIATQQVPDDRLAGRVLIGELSLTGDLRPVHGALAMALSLAKRRIGPATNGESRTWPTVLLPAANAREAALVPGITVQSATSLNEVCQDLRGEFSLPICHDNSRSDPDGSKLSVGNAVAYGNFSEVHGQSQAKRALEIAAAGAHSVLLVGPPGAGKSMLAQRLPGILPAMNDEEALDTGAIASLAGRFDSERWRQRPFRAPHHSASMAALIGGGQRLRPGEISLAHNGVLFLDELPEFGARTLDSLREPLETGRIALSRAARQLELPARFQLVGAMNPCVCGHYGNERCRCTPDQVMRYQRRVSGPLLDRLDLHLWLQPVSTEQLTAAETAETSAVIAQRVLNARTRQWQRQQKTNSELTAPEVQHYCHLATSAAHLLHRSARQLQWSGRVFHRVQKIARTIADLAGEENITAAHVAEAVGARRALALANEA